MFISLSTHLYVSLSVCLYVCLSVCATDRLSQSCCQLDCYLTESCVMTSSPVCGHVTHAPVECAMGESSRITLEMSSFLPFYRITTRSKRLLSFPHFSVVTLAVSVVRCAPAADVRCAGKCARVNRSNALT